MHTKEPWEIFHYATRSLTGVCVPDPEGDGATIADFVNREDAERAVACVNACAGIKDPAAIRELVEAAKAALEELKLLEVHCARNGIAVNVVVLDSPSTAIAAHEGKSQ